MNIIRTLLGQPRVYAKLHQLNVNRDYKDNTGDLTRYDFNDGKWKYRHGAFGKAKWYESHDVLGPFTEVQ